MDETTAAIVVTHNRKQLVTECLDAILAQIKPVDKIILIDNASTDGTPELLQKFGYMSNTVIDYVRLPENIGGAGGFHEGLKLGYEAGYDWFWLMDDDAKPYPDALAELMKISMDPRNVYGSVAVNGDELSWRLDLMYPNSDIVEVRLVKDVPIQAVVNVLPFIGFMIHRDLIGKIGLPDRGLFIAGDDVEYCIRAKKEGAEIIVSGKSYIEHPKSQPYKISFFKLNCFRLPPWKRYYDARNRLLIARKHYGIKLFTHTIPGTIIRSLAAIINETNKYEQFRACIAGTVDGLLGRMGKRHDQ